MGLLEKGDTMEFGKAKNEAVQPTLQSAQPVAAKDTPAKTTPSPTKKAPPADRKAAALEALERAKARVREIERKEGLAKRKADNHLKMLLAGIILETIEKDAALKNAVSATLKAKKGSLRDDEKTIIEEFFKARGL